MDDATLGIGRCRDALTWHIDMNGGGMSQMWLHPWLEGESDRPAIDWCASTPEEALLMVTIAVAIAINRKSSYRTYKAQLNAKLLPISPKLPEIVIQVDEGAEVLSPANRDPITRQVRDGLETLQRIGRNEAVNVVVTALRPTQETIAPQILKQSHIKVGMYGMDEADLGHLYGWRQGISVEDLPTKGCAFLGIGRDAPRPMKAWIMEPEQIQAAALVIAGYRPELDEASAEIANGDFDIDLGGKKPATMTGIYASRYERMRSAFTGNNPALPVKSNPARPAPATATKATPLRVIQGGAANWPDPLPTTTPQPVAAHATSAAAWPDPLPTQRAQSAGAVATAEPPAALPTGHVRNPVPELLVRLGELFRERDAERLWTTEVILPALRAHDPELSPQRLAKMLRACGVEPAREAWTENGGRGRGYYRADVDQAIVRIRNGEITPDQLSG